MGRETATAARRGAPPRTSSRAWRKRYSARGNPFRVLESVVYRIPDTWLDIVIYLYASAPDAEEGVRTGGSGFLVEIPCESIPGAHHVLAVTNRHVVEDGATVIRLNTKEGGRDVLDLTERDWTYHEDGDDLAISILSLDPDIHHYQTVRVSEFLTKEKIDKYNIGPGDEAIILGRFVTHEGVQKNLPSVRVGHIAQMPWEPIKKRRGNTEYMQQSFLVEAQSISGYSGSPVLYSLETWLERPERPGLEYDSDCDGLLGIDWGHLNDWTPVCDAKGNPLPQKLIVALNSGMMTVVPAWRLTEMLEGPTVREMLRRVEREMARELGPPDASADTASADPDWHDPAEAARRRDETLRRMLNTPPRPGKRGKPPAS